MSISSLSLSLAICVLAEEILAGRLGYQVVGCFSFCFWFEILGFGKLVLFVKNLPCWRGLGFCGLMYLDLPVFKLPRILRDFENFLALYWFHFVNDFSQIPLTLISFNPLCFNNVELFQVFIFHFCNSVFESSPLTLIRRFWCNLFRSGINLYCLFSFLFFN